MTGTIRHHGHAVLRLFIPDTDARRAYVIAACKSEKWNRAALEMAIERWTSCRPTEVQVQHVRDFIESI